MAIFAENYFSIHSGRLSVNAAAAIDFSLLAASPPDMGWNYLNYSHWFIGLMNILI